MAAKKNVREIGDDTCKYMRAKHNWTPNDYDLWFQYNHIPANVIVEDVPNLSARLDKLTPLSKKVHIVLNTPDEEYNNTVNVSTDLTLTVDTTVKRVKIV